MEHNFHFKSSETNTILPFTSLLPLPPLALHDEEWQQRTCVMVFSTITDNHSWSTRVY